MSEVPLYIGVTSNTGGRVGWSAYMAAVLVVHGRNKKSCTERYSSRFKNNCFAVLRSSSKEGSYLRLVDLCITQLQAESNKEEEEGRNQGLDLERASTSATAC